MIGAFLPTKRTNGVSTSELLQRSKFPGLSSPELVLRVFHGRFQGLRLLLISSLQLSKVTAKVTTTGNFERLVTLNCARDKAVKLVLGMEVCEGNRWNGSSETLESGCMEGIRKIRFRLYCLSLPPTLSQ